MTCIIGLVENDKVYLGADSATVSGWEVRQTKRPKVFKRGKFLIATCGSVRMNQILHHFFEPLENTERLPDDDFMVKIVGEAIRKQFKDLGFSKVDNNRETGGAFLIGYNGHLYSYDSDFQIGEVADGIDAMGVGSAYALGAMYVLKKLPPKQRILESLKASAYFSGAVGPPFRVMSI